MPPAVRRLIWPAVAAATGLAVLISLGVWQLQRLQWKEALIARVTAGVDAPPQAAPGPDTWQSLDLAGWEYRPVTVAGTFRYDAETYANETLVQPRGPFGGFGFFVMTPLATADGWMVYVNRGFVPGDRKDPATRVAGNRAGETTVVGLLRRPRSRAWFMPADDIDANEWFSRDPGQYARAAGLPVADVAPYIIDAGFDAGLRGGLPQGGETIVTFANDHLQYALTWFGLAAGLAGVFVVYAWGRRGACGRDQA
jgi:surfeit locus 1 family protein